MKDPEVVIEDIGLEVLQDEAIEGIFNSKEIAYPEIVVDGYGKVPFPEGPFTPNNTALRPKEFTQSFKLKFQKWWIEKGYPWPEGDIEIHHIKPLAHGGTNTFENLVPFNKEQHTPFLSWWRSYPKE